MARKGSATDRRYGQLKRKKRVYGEKDEKPKGQVERGLQAVRP